MVTRWYVSIINLKGTRTRLGSVEITNLWKFGLIIGHRICERIMQDKTPLLLEKEISGFFLLKFRRVILSRLIF